MAGIDQSTVVPDAIDPKTVILDGPAPPRSAVAEVGTGLLRGAMVGLPRMAGQALQYVSGSPEAPLAKAGKGMVTAAEERAQKPYLQAQPESHGAITNALASGAEMVPAAIGVPLAIGATAATGGAGPALAGGLAVAGAGALFGAQAGQETLDKAQKAGVDDETAQHAARLNAASTFATQAALGVVGGRALGVFGTALNKIVGKEGPELAASTLEQLAGRGGTLMPVLKQMPFTAAEATAVNAGQTATTAAIEQNAGIDNTSPVDAALASIGPSLGLTALMTPLSLVARGAQVRSAAGRTAALAHPETDPALRTQLADQYAAKLAAVDPASAQAFRDNATLAIKHKLAMDIDSRMLDPGFVTAPPSTEPLLLGRDPRAGQMVVHPDGTVGFASEIENWINSLPPDQQIIERARLQGHGQQEVPGNALAPDGTPQLPNNPSQRTLFTFPDGTTTNSIADVDAYINTLPENQRTEARAKLLGLGPQEAKPEPVPQDALDLHEQVKTQLQAAGIEPAKMLTRKQFGETHPDLKGQELARAYRAYTESPDTLRDLMRQDADKYDQLQASDQQRATGEEAAAAQPRNQPLPEQPFQQEAPPPSRAMAEAFQAAFRRAASDKAAADAEAQKAREIDAIANIGQGARTADAAERGEVAPDPNAARSKTAIVEDWKAAMAANDMDTKAQALAPFTKRIEALGLEDMKTHQEQIDAVKAAMDDKKMSQTMRDRLSMLVNKWEADLTPAQKDTPPADAATTTAAAAPAPADKLPGETPPAAAAAPIAPVEPIAPAPIRTKAEVIALPVSQLKGEAPAHAEQLGTNITAARFTPDQQALIDGLKSGNGGRVGALGRLRNKVGDAMQSLLDANRETPIPDFDERMQRLVQQADDIEAISTEALARDREERALKQAQEAKPRPMPTIEGNAPPHAGQLGENIPHTNVSGIADAAADRAAALRAEFAGRVRNGEELSVAEQVRLESLTEVAKALDNYTEGKASPSDEGFVRQLAQFIEDASVPWKNVPDYKNPGDHDMVIPGLKMDNPVDTDLGLLAPAAVSGKLADVLEHLSVNGSQEWVRQLAGVLHDIVGDARIERGYLPDKASQELGALVQEGGASVARYSTDQHKVEIFPRGASEEVILHESTHAATVAALDRAASIDRPKNQFEAGLKKAYDEIEAIRTEAATRSNATDNVYGTPFYGLTNAHEFVAELHSNTEFQRFLRDVGTPTSLWRRAVDAVRRLLGMSPRETDFLDRALTASSAFFMPREMAAMFDRPDTAARAPGEVLSKMISTIDSDRRRMADLGTQALRATLPWRTVDNIAHGVRGMVELVKSGFADGVTGHERANMAHTVASEHLRTPLNSYVSRMQRELGKIGDRRVDVQKEMMTIAGEASIGNFDFRKNGRDNIAANKGLSQQDKPFIDEIHRRYTQLQRQYPELGKLLDEGERLNRGSLIERVATLAANLMDARAGVARRLQADLTRMSPDDANRARLAESVRLANLESYLASAHSNGLDFMDPSLSTAANPSPTKYQTGGHAELARRLDAAFKAANSLPDGVPLKAHMGALERVYRSQVDRPYFQLGRDGDYFVKVGFKGIDQRINGKIQDALKGTNKVVGDLTRGDDHAFFRVNTAAEAKALHDRLVQAGEGRVIDTAWGLLGDKNTDASGVAPALRGLLGTLDEAVANTKGLHVDQAQLLKDTITRQVLSLLPETSSRSAQMARRGIPGYDGDFMRSFARRAGGAVHDTAGLYTSRSYMAAADQRAKAIEQLNRTGSEEGRIRAQLVDNEINKRYADMMKPVGNEIVQIATSLSHSFYLGMSPAFFIRALAQPWHRGLPILGSKFGFADGMGEIGRATPTAMKVVANSVAAAVKKDGWRGVIGAPVELKDLGLTAGEQKFIEELHARGILDLGEGSTLARMAQGDNAKMNDALKLASFTAGLSEMSNRLVMGLAAYRLATKRPGLLGKETATDYAVRAINLAMDNFDPNNTARAIGRHGIAGPLTPLFTQFSNYAFQTMQQIFRTAHDGFFGQDKSAEGLQRAKEAKREFAGLMATTAVISGALGMPFANAFAGIYNNLMSDPDDPKDVRIAMRNWANETFGDTFGRVLTGGVGTLVNLDMSTFGLQDILPGSEFLASRALWKDRSETQARSMLGPAVSLGLDLGDAVSKMSDGYWLKGIEKALPVGLRTYYKTAEMAGAIGPGGYTDSRGNPLPMKAGASDLAWRVLGFQTAAKAEQGEAQRDFSTSQELLKHRRDVITDRFYKGVTTNPAAMPDALAALQRFNSINPAQAITGHEIEGTIRGHLVANALGAATGIGIPVSKRKVMPLLQNERFAAMPTN